METSAERRAIFDKRLSNINPHRHKLLEALEQAGRLEDPHALLEAYALPLVDPVTSSTHYVELLAQLALHPSARHPFYFADPTLQTSAQLVIEHLTEIAPLPTLAERRRRVRLVLDFVLEALAARSWTFPDTPLETVTCEVLDLATAMHAVPRRSEPNRIDFITLGSQRGT